MLIYVLVGRKLEAHVSIASSNGPPPAEPAPDLRDKISNDSDDSELSESPQVPHVAPGRGGQKAEANLNAALRKPATVNGKKKKPMKVVNLQQVTYTCLSQRPKLY